MRLPIYLDGSDGSIWSSRDTWEEIFQHVGLASRRFVRVSDLIDWLATNKINVPDLPIELPFDPDLSPAPEPMKQVATCPVQQMVEHSEKHFSELQEVSDRISKHFTTPDQHQP
jgi:hypothetical protein